MATVNMYLNFSGQCEEAFNFYKSVFGGEFVGGISRFGDMPAEEGAPAVPAEVANQVMHMALPIGGGCILMGSDAPAAFGIPAVVKGNNMYIALSPDSREDALRIFTELTADGEVSMPLEDTFWGSYFGSGTDRYGIQWMVDYMEAPCVD